MTKSSYDFQNVSHLSAFDAFKRQLDTLSLNEFPCGLGNWIEKGNTDQSSAKFSSTLRDYGVQYVKGEALEELIYSSKSPWYQDYSWSDEAKSLREYAVQHPLLINEKFVLNYFKSLRILDKKITNLDERFTKFTNLEELVLTANYLTEINSKTLPQTLKVLELCANRVNDLFSLVQGTPPRLTHLGLSLNGISTISDYFTAEYWPALLSLDLGHNNLTDLTEVIYKLENLPKLRNLILQGNPLSLTPSYRGFTIDTLRKLSFLDDINITADEKHHYRGLAKHKELILNDAKIVLSVESINGISMPEELKNTDDLPEFPIISYNYLVNFKFIEDKSTEEDIFNIIHDDLLTESLVDSETFQHTEYSNKTKTEGEESENYTQEYSEKNHDQKVPEINQNTISLSENESQMNENTKNSAELMASVNAIEKNIKNIRSASFPWAEEITADWSLLATRNNLLELRDFFKNGMEIELIQEKVLSYPADQMPNDTLTPATSQTRLNKGKDEKKTAVKNEKSAKPKEKPADDSKKKKKKGEPDVEMSSLPPEHTTLASVHADLSEFTNGEKIYKQTFVCNVGQQNCDQKEEKKDKKKPSCNSGKKKDKDEAKSPKPTKKDDPKNKRRNSVIQKSQETDSTVLPTEIKITVELKLHHWLTAREALQNEHE